MLKTAIAGTGNVGFHLARQLRLKGYPLQAVVSRCKETANELIRTLGVSALAVEWSDLHTLDCELLILAIPDQQIPEVIQQYDFPQKAIVVHTSGSQPMSILEPFPHHGVFYPFQTFSREKNPHFSQIPFYLEASDDFTREKLEVFAREFSQHVHFLNSEQRLKIHLAAVFASNFTNHLYVIAEKILSEAGVKLADFRHLIEETTQKALAMPPQKAQTGPAVRGDQAIIQKHLQLLETHPEWQKIYELLSEQIDRLRKT